ncbi:hypothetical protein CDL15_Pgr024721 [Punica granatum]|uniref:F-box domain-containing protein n=1 Tax=Punica granatum TaxID=22663 RepID=A0A218W4S4_PUNGR|nr:hypothetical protein CDL15_Pgr024721 [Punica granatum]
MEEEQDRISDLPGHVMDQILSYLHIDEEVRTSILSSKWRYKWATVPVLSFDTFLRDITGHTPVEIINRVLLSHAGPIRKFEICHQDKTNDDNGCDVDRWILHLSRRSFEELTLCFFRCDPYKIPTHLFGMQDLVKLDLLYCSMSLPPSF